MKINRFFALAVIALLVVGAMGVLGVKAFAKGNGALTHQTSVQSQNCSQDQNNGSDGQDASPDTDNVELQCGDQNAPDGQGNVTGIYTDTTEVQDGNRAPDGQGDVTGVYTDTNEVQDGNQNAPDGQESTGKDTESTTDAESAVVGTPTFTPEQAQTAALAVHPGTIIKTELDNENGQLVYSVELADGADIKVDAMTGKVLTIDSGQD